MIEKICNYLTKKISNSLPDVDDERAEIINYGLQNIVGEIPKLFLVLLISYFLGVLELTIFAFFILLPYRAVSGGFHLHTHLGCLIGTTLFYCGNAFLSKMIVLDPVIVKYAIIAGIWGISMVFIRLYAPADTENVPILREKERKTKRYLSYIIATVGLVIAIFVTDSTISNILIFGTLLQSLSITKAAYKLTNNKYGYEVYS